MGVYRVTKTDLAGSESRYVTENVLDDPEQLFREGAFVSAGRWRHIGDGSFVRAISWTASEFPEIGGLQAQEWWRPKSLPRFDGPAINDLVVHRWHGPLLTAEHELGLILDVHHAQVHADSSEHPFRKISRAYGELLAGFHRTVLQVAAGRMPRYWRPRRTSLRDKHTNNLLFEDLVAAGVAAMWKAALKFNVESGHRLWTAARLPVIGAISDEARLWRRSGSGEGRLDRWLYTHPRASPEQVLRAQHRLVKRPVFHSLQEAAEGLKQFWAWQSADFDYSTTEANEPNDAAGSGSFVGMYSCFSRYMLSPQLRPHEPLGLLVERLAGGGFDAGPDVGNASRPKAPREPLDCTETAFVQFKNGKRQVTRQKAASYCYGIVATPELRARALDDLEFAKERWERRIRRGPLPAEQYPRWSTKFGLGRPEHENKQIVPAYVPVTRFTWKVEYRDAEANVVAELESPSWHCRHRVQPCPHCKQARRKNRPQDLAAVGNLPQSHNVSRLSTSLSAA